MASNYWSSTTNANNTGNAWNVNFNNGNVNNNNKTNSLYVRAVRSGKCSLLSFRSVHDAWLDCRRRKRGTINALRFEVDAAEKLFDLACDLQKGTYRPSRSVCFVTASPKLREVFAADFRDRVVHHLLVRELEKLYEPVFIHDSYACRVNKGTQAAVRRLREFMRRCTKNRKVPAYFLQLDIRSFFTSIDRRVLYALLEKKLCEKQLPQPDRDSLLELVRITVFHDCTSAFVFKGDRARLDRIPPHKTLFRSGPNRGLPIGNLTSQFFANVYLNELDHFVRHSLRCRMYLRYVDDFILLDQSPERLTAWREQIAAFLRDRLALELKPAGRIRRVSEGADFLGYVVRPGYVLVRRRVVHNLKAKLALFRKKMVRETNMGGRAVMLLDLPPDMVTDLRQMLASYLGHFRHANAFNLTQAIFQGHGWLETIFSLQGGRLVPRLTYRGFCRSLKVQVMFYRDRLRDCVLLFQVGSFVELYGNDAADAGARLGLRVRRNHRGMDAAAGVPLRMVKNLIQRLVAQGRNVALILQYGDGPFVRNRSVREVYRVAT